MKQVKDYYGNKVDYEAAVEYMDSEIRERLHSEMCPCTPQEFFDAYAREHMRKFENEEWAPYFNGQW